MSDKEFKVNDFITLKLERSKTNIYINNEKFIQCKFLLLDVDLNDMIFLNELGSIDEFSERSKNPFDIRSSHLTEIPPEVEFWGHCSNLQVWVENNYNTNLLHSNIAFPLLKKLSEVGDPIARRIFKEKIIRRIESGHVPTIIYLVMDNYLDFFTQEEFEMLIERVKDSKYVLEEKNLDLIVSFDVDRRLNINELVFLIEHPKINLFELLITFGEKYFEKNGNYIGDFRLWINYILDILTQKKPKFLEKKIRMLIKEHKIRIKYMPFSNERTEAQETKVDYSIMDEFSILLLNNLKYGLRKFDI